MRITVDLYSGRQNPSWTLTESNRALAEQQLAALSEPTRACDVPQLGYRGVLLAGPSEVAETRVLRTAVLVAGRLPMLDRDRKLERWLLSTAPEPMRAELRRLMESEFDESSGVG